MLTTNTVKCLNVPGTVAEYEEKHGTRDHILKDAHIQVLSLHTIICCTSAVAT